MTSLSDLPQVSPPLPWHSKEWARFAGLLDTGQLPHAVVFTGEKHIGKSQFTLALARLLLCAQPKSGLACGVCHPCELSRAGSHGDFLWVEPEEKSRVVKIDQVRNAVQFTNRTAGFGTRKVIVIAPADSMNVSAFNALLKSLEEPAADTYIFLVCHRMHNVPPTIRSRCQLVRLPTPAAMASLEWLDQITGGRETSEGFLALADGKPLLAEQFFLMGGADQIDARQKGLKALLDGQADAAQIAKLWHEVDIDVVLEQLTEELQRHVRALGAQALNTGRGQAAFGLLDSLARLRQAVSAGANPGKQLLVDALMSKIHRELGSSVQNDNIQGQTGGADR